ncbi:hypothetical protein KFU94_42505 [Chloroflexi bacterium TSY]|nr:hypothetical protein [Chloroflexi bacterium TSY]
MLTTTNTTQTSLIEQISTGARRLAVALGRQRHMEIIRKIVHPPFLANRLSGTKAVKKIAQNAQQREANKMATTNGEIERLELAVRQGSVNAI